MCTSVLPAASAAQEVVAVGVEPGVGSRVRVVVDQESVIGVLAAADAAAVTLVVDGQRLTVPRQSITGMQVSAGRRGRAGEGALLGAVAGLLAGLVSPTDDPGNCLGAAYCDRGQAVVSSMLGSTLLGAAIGAFIRTDRWVDARVTGGIAVAAGPGAVGITGRIRF